MLSRVADSLYWTSRYLERAEHSARLGGVHLSLLIDQPADRSAERWQRVAACLGLPPDPLSGDRIGEFARTIAFDGVHPASILSCITQARENARQVREQISSEMWEQLNRMYHELRAAAAAGVSESQLAALFVHVREGAHLFAGITDSTSNHGEGWQFMRVGQYLERAGAVARLLDAHLRDFPERGEAAMEATATVEWIGLLRACTAFEAYCKIYTADLRPDRILEFLLLNEVFPHSVRFAADQVHAALGAIEEFAGSRRAARLARLAGRFESGLRYAQADEILAGGAHGFLGLVQQQCDQIHAGIQQAYVGYTVEAALGGQG